jgi:pimeloyl-ACP methyl ester carboxylesterase
MPVVRDLDVHYDQAGQGRAALVLVHGNFASRRWWRPVLERLPPGLRAYAPEMRGCGDTRGRGGYSIPDLARDLGGFVDALKLPRFHLVGHSLGGAVAMEYALARRRSLRSLTLVAPAPAAGLAGLREGQGALARRLRAGVAPSPSVLLRAARLSRTLLGRVALRAQLTEMMPAADLGAVGFEELLDDAAGMDPEAVVGFYRALDDWNVETRLARLGVPTLVLWGEKDAIVPRAALERMVTLLTSAELRVWPQVGHSPQLERPAEFIGLLADVVRRRSPWARLLAWLRCRWPWSRARALPPPAS